MEDVARVLRRSPGFFSRPNVPHRLLLASALMKFRSPPGDASPRTLRERHRRARVTPAPTSDDIQAADDIAKKIGTAAAASPMPISRSPLTPKHHSKAARALFRPSRCGARSVPVDKVDHSVAVLLQPSSIVSRVARGDIGELGVVNVDFQGVCARRVQQPDSASLSRRDWSRPSTWRRGCQWRRGSEPGRWSRSSPLPAPPRA